MLVLIIRGLIMWGRVERGGWSRDQNEGDCVLVIRQAKECVEKRFICDSYCHTERYFGHRALRLFLSCASIIVLNYSLNSSVPTLRPSLVA